MAVTTIAQIVEAESKNTDKINLYREGLFLKAYNHSAFLFQKHVRSFRPVRKYYKSVGADVVMLGFPSGNLPAVFPGADFEANDDSHVCVACSEINLKEYSIWFDAVQPAPEKPKKETKRTAIQPATEFSAGLSVRLFESEKDFITTPGRSIIEKVAEELETFPIENSTPMECMLFLSHIKTELKRGRSGGL